MKNAYFGRIVFRFILAAITLMNAHAQDEPIVQIGTGTVERGSVVEIPIYFNNGGDHNHGFTAFQFDLTFEPSFFDELDTSQCFYRLEGVDYLAECRRQDWPNQDVVRFLAVSLSGEPIPSGELGYLVFQAKVDAASGISPLSLLECTSLAVGSDQEEVALNSNNYKPGEIVVFGQEPPTKPKAPENVLALDGRPVFSEKPLYRKQYDIPDPVPVLAAGHETLTLVMPDGREIEATSKHFIPRAGYLDRLDCKDTQVPDNNPDTPLSFRWYGEIDKNGWLGVTVVNNVVRGSLVTAEHSYQLEGSPEQGYQLKEIDQNELPSAHGKGLNEQFMKFANPGAKNALAISAGDPLLNTLQTRQSTGPTQLDLLIMYTAQAEIDAGGSSGLDALLQQSIDNTNQAFINSGYSDLSVREVHRELLTGFVPVPLPPPPQVDRSDRDSLRVNPQILAARDEHYADLTIVMLRNFFDNSEQQRLSYCGITYIQSPTCGTPGEYPDCGMGVDFEDYAIALVSVECANLAGRNSFPHEIGHMMGGEHPPGRGQPPGNASFPWSYAHFIESGSASLRFGTMLWVPVAFAPEVP